MTGPNGDSGKWPTAATPGKWVWADFEEVFENVTSSDRKLKLSEYAKSGALPVVDQGQELIGGYTDSEELKHPSSLPVVLFGDHTRCVKYLDFAFVQGADGTKVLRPLECVEPRFSFWALRTIDLPAKGYSRHFRFLRNSKFLIPPRAEQQRIVAKIEALQERSRRAREALSEVGPLLEQFRQSVLAAAFRGELTADWRATHPNVGPPSELLHRIRAERRCRWEQAELAKYEAHRQKPPKNWEDRYREPEALDDSDLPELPKGWCWTTVGSISEVVRGASPRPAGDPKYFDGDHTPWITVQEITKDDEIYLTKTATSLTEVGRATSRFIPSGTLLLTNSGATLGVPKITKIDGCINDGSVAIISVSGEFQLYLYFYLRSLTESLRRINQGAAQPNLNTDIVRQITVPIAPAAEQEEIIESLKMALAMYRSLKREISELTGELDQLDQSILAKAFRGELVPQDPSDEPASALLERIRDQRIRQSMDQKQTSKSHQTSKLGKKSSKLEPQQLTLAEVLRTAD